MLQLKNNTPFEAGIAVLPDQYGVDSLIIIIKATFSLNGEVNVAAKQVPLNYADEYWGEPGQSSLKYVSEMHLLKPATDIALVGQAQTPDRRPVNQLDVLLAAANLRKVIRVFGNRWWISSKPTPPKPFETMPLVYERAFGGFHEIDGELLFEPRNPVGCSFAGKRKNRELDKLPLPNLEDPYNLISNPDDCPAPAGFGFIAAAWLPRKDYAGTYDENWQKSRAPFLPDDFDSRFFNAAHPELVSSGYFKGGEPIEADNVSPLGRLSFKLPICQIKTSVSVAGAEEKPPLNLETVLVEPDELRFTMLWRGALSCDKKALKIEQINIDLQQLTLNG
jgi:hypothetical protein